jgi:hypothetical protein
MTLDNPGPLQKPYFPKPGRPAPYALMDWELHIKLWLHDANIFPRF